MINVNYFFSPVASFNQALRFYTKTEYPDDWAWTHKNLGFIYLHLQDDDKLKNLNEAIPHFKNALDVITKEKYPHEYKMLLDNLYKVQKQIDQL